MDQDTVINLASQAMSLAFKVAGPLLLGAMVVGLLVSIFQAVTQIQEQSLTLIPKIADDRRDRGRARPVDARPDGRLHDQPLLLDPDARGLMGALTQGYPMPGRKAASRSNLLANHRAARHDPGPQPARRQRARRLHPRTRAGRTPVPARAAVLLADGPPARARRSSPSASRSASPRSPCTGSTSPPTPSRSPP